MNDRSFFDHKLIRRFTGREFKGRFYRGDGFATKNKNLGFMEDAKFSAAYEWSSQTRLQW